MNTSWTREACAGFVVIASVAVLAGCDPRDSLQNQDYLPYLDGYERWDTSVVVEAFNQLDSNRGDFSCQQELEDAQQSIRREEGGPIKADGSKQVKSFRACLERFSKAAGVDQTRAQAAVLSDWVNHNFLSDIQKRIDAEVAAAQKRLDGVGCGGEACKGLTVVGDLAMPRLATKNGIPFDDAVGLCSSANFGGLRPWRLPSAAELSAILGSDKLPSEAAKIAYWSGERVFDESGNVVVSGLRFQKVDGSESRPQPESIPLVRRRLPVKAKVRCVYDLAKRGATKTEVDVMEQALVEAGCTRSGWMKHLRVREDLIVMWETVEKMGPSLEDVCKELDWCSATWSAPNSDQAKKLASDPWFTKTATNRCVASLPEG